MQKICCKYIQTVLTLIHFNVMKSKTTNKDVNNRHLIVMRWSRVFNSLEFSLDCVVFQSWGTGYRRLPWLEKKGTSFLLGSVNSFKKEKQNTIFISMCLTLSAVRIQGKFLQKLTIKMYAKKWSMHLDGNQRISREFKADRDQFGVRLLVRL